MTPSQARAFQAVAAEGSFTAAARSLGISQPTITNQVRLIEARYQVELFHRGSRGVRLTDTGAALLVYVRRMFGSYDEAVSFLREAQEMRFGHLRIGSYGPYGAIQMMARFRNRFPGISLSITFANSRELAHRVLHYDLDVAILTNIEHHPEFFVIPFSSPQLVVIAPRNHQWKASHSVSREELRNHTLIRREPGSAVRAAFDQLFGKSKFDPGKIIEIGSREGVVGAVAEGLGVAPIFDEGLMPEDRVVRLTLARHNIRSKVDVACLAERRQSKIVNGFLTIAAEIATIK